MAIPNSRKTFKEYCLRRLGAPVLKINVEDDQIEDRIDEALQYFADYHFDGTDKIYFKYPVTQDDILNRYINIPDNIIGVVNLFEIGNSLNTNNLFNIRYQIALNDLYTLTNVSMTPYYMAMQNIQFLEQMLVGKQPLRFNRHVGRCYIDMDWNIVNPGDYLILECYTVIDPNEFPKVWNDRWLQRYATCLFKIQWAGNLSKYEGMSLPGGVKFNGQQMYQDAIKEREMLEKEMIYSYSLPASDMIG